MFNLRCSHILLIVAIAVFFCKPLNAQAQVFNSANSQGTGEAGRASFDPFGSHFMNPATLVGIPNYVIGGAYQMTRPDSENPVTYTTILVTDNEPSSLLAAGFGYVNKRSSYFDKIITDQDFSISLATRILPKLSIGWLGRQLVRQNTNGPSWTKHNMNLGALIMPATFMTLGIVGYDILTDDDLDMVPVIALGSEFNIMSIFKIRADISRQEKLNPDKKTILNAGAEFDLSEGFLLRTGGIWDTLNNQTYLTLGLGWIGPRLSAAYAYKNNVNVNRDVSHNFQLWVNF